MSEEALNEEADSIFRPSYSATWANCAGALLPSRFAPDTAGYEAAEGTVFHNFIAEWQNRGRPDDWLGRIIRVFKEYSTEHFDIEVDDDFFYYAQIALDRYADIPGDRFVETRVDISDLTPIPNQKGTADLFICQPGILDCVDWKYGRGVQVFAEKNTQELCYVWGVFKQYDAAYHFETIRLHIAQPRLNHFDVWEITREELIEWADWLRERAQAAWQRGAPRTVSPKACQWCKIRKDCSALVIAQSNLADLSFDVIEEPVTEADMKTAIALNQTGYLETKTKSLPDPLALPTQQLANIKKYRKLFEAWFKDVDEELITRALQGEEIEGWKIVEGRSRRKYRDEEEAAKKLGVFIEPFQTVIVSPNQAEKLLRPAGIRGNLLTAYMRTLTVKPRGKPTLAPDGDNRLAIPNPVDDTFESEDEEIVL